MLYAQSTITVISGWCHKNSKSVTWCFTPSQPLRLYQGDATRAALPIPINVCSMFVCLNNGTAASFFISNVYTDVDACDCTRGLYGHCERVCTRSWLWERNPLLHCGLKPASVLCLVFQQDSLPKWAIPVPELELLCKQLCSKVLCCFRLDLFRMKLCRFVLARWGTEKRLAYNVTCSLECNMHTFLKVLFMTSLTQTARRKMAVLMAAFLQLSNNIFQHNRPYIIDKTTVIFLIRKKFLIQSCQHGKI